jgi:hypothetical protein
MDHSLVKVLMIFVNRYDRVFNKLNISQMDEK